MIFQSNLLHKPNYKLFPELREFICRMINELAKNEIDGVINWNSNNPTIPKPSLFAKVLIQSEETDANIGAIKDNFLTVASGETQPTNYNTLITLDFDKSNPNNISLEAESISCNCRQYAIATDIRIRHQRELGKKGYVEQIVKYLKDNLTRNDFEFVEILGVDQNWSGQEYKSTCFHNWDPLVQTNDLIIDPTTNWYFYQFQIIFEIQTNQIN